MDPKVTKRLERELEKAIAEVICRLGLKMLPVLPSHRTMALMAKAAVSVYEEAMDSPRDSTATDVKQE